MLICTRCNITRAGNRPTYARCECGGQYAVVRDGGKVNSESEDSQELVLGGDKQRGFQKYKFSHNRKSKEAVEEGAYYGKSNVLEM